MEYLRRNCVCCRKLLQSYYTNGDLKTCIICLEKARETYRHNKEIMIIHGKTYKDNNVEKRNKDTAYIILFIRNI